MSTTIYPTTYPTYSPYTGGTYTTTTSTTILDTHQVTSALQEAHREIAVLRDRVACQDREAQQLWGCVTFLSENPGKTVEDWRKYCQVSAKINSTLAQETANAFIVDFTGI